MPPPNPPNCPAEGVFGYGWFSWDPAPLPAWCGMPPANQPGQVDRVGCAVGCQPCIQHDPVVFEPQVGVSTSGSRWLRPDNAHESRDAYGKYVFMPSKTPVRLPYPGSSQQISMVWAMGFLGGWKEYWQDDTCSEPGLSSPCGGGCDCHSCINWDVKRASYWWFTGYQYAWGPNTIICTGNYFYGAQPEQVYFNYGTLGQAAFVTTSKNAGGDVHNDGAGGCTPNFLALCLGKELRPPEQCQYQWGTNHEPQIFVDNHTIWDRFYVWMPAPSSANAVQLYQDEDSPDQDQAAIEAKNAALRWLAANQEAVHIDQMDYVGNRNSDLDFWSRGWNDSALTYPTLADVPYIVETWENCYLRYSGHGVIVEWVPWWIGIYASIVLMRRDTRQVCQPWAGSALGQSRQMNRYYPLVKLEIRMRMAARAKWADWESDPEAEHQLVRTWLPAEDPNRIVDLEITNREIESHPLITAPDKIVYVDGQGRTFDGLPPLTITWKGCLEPLTRHAWADHFPHEYYVNSQNYAPDGLCRAVAEGMQDVTIHAEASHPDEELDQLYTGQIRIGVNPYA